MVNNITYGNFLYLQEWIRLNSSLSKLKIINNTLIYEENGEQYQQDISKFYMPLLLENIVFRNKLATYSAKDLFNIIKVNCQAKDIIEKEQKQMNEYIKNINVINDHEISIILDSNEIFYLQANEPNKIYEKYNSLLNNKIKLKLFEFGELIKNDN